MNTATARAAEAIESAEGLYADEVGATSNLSPAAKVALVLKIADAIQKAVTKRSGARFVCAH